jgi:serine phosphatase RsbU (regulator of sigma subunit)/streptogramin lyase
MYNGITFTHFTTREGLSSNSVWSIVEDSQGNLWFGTMGGGACKYNYDRETFIHFTEREGLHFNVRSIMEDSHGNLWFGTWGDGVRKFDGKTFTNFTVNEGLSNNYVWSILEDSHGNLWFATAGGGVSVYNDGNFVKMTINKDISIRGISSIFEDSSGNLWFGAFGAGVSMYDGESYINYTENKGLNLYNVMSILEDSHGNLWFGSFSGGGTGGGGVSMYNDGTFTRFTRNEGLSGAGIRSLLEDSHGNIWIGTTTGGLSMYDGKNFTHFTENEGLSDNQVWSVIEDTHGNIWIGTVNGGVSKYEGEAFTHYTEKEGLLSNDVRCIMEDSRGNIWIGTSNSGVSMFNGKTFMHFTTREGLSTDAIESILEDNDCNIWVATPKGLNHLVFRPERVPSTLNDMSIPSINKDSTKVASDYPIIYTYGSQEGLIDMSFWTNSVLIDSRNRVWWGTSTGTASIDMNNYKIPDKPPLMQLDRIEIDEQYRDYRNLKEDELKGLQFDSVARFYNYPLNLEMPYNHNHLTFYFSGIDWSAPHKTKYSYKMEGLGEDWSMPTLEAVADYRSLPYGTYTFMVRAIGPAQKWSEPIEYTFTINPPLWLTWWAKAGYGILALILIYGFVRWRTATLKQRQKELEQTVKHRTKEILEQKNEIEAQRDEIETQRDSVTQQRDQIVEQKKAITESIQYARKIQTAILPPDEVLKYLLPKHFILYKPKEIVSGDFYWLTNKKGKIIIAVTDSTGHGVPGAFMSMLGSALLNEIVSNINTLQANLILNELRDQVILSLRQTGEAEEAREGMDIALCILDKENLGLQYAGAHNPLFLVREGELTEIKADRMPIGISPDAGKSFTNHEMTLRKDDALYMFSDGYLDQYGGEKGKKFMKSRFSQLLLDIQDSIMFEQKQILEQALNEWMGLTGKYGKQYEQIDDILVMGIKI